jgi:heterotetrameric sarcosine oxidase gamma subunit
MRRTCVSAPEHTAAGAVTLAVCPADVVELSTYVVASADARRRVAGLELPACGRCGASAQQLVLSTRPGRWLLLSARAAPGAAAERWMRACAGQGAVVDLSCALTTFLLSGAPARELLSRGCRVDLEPEAFPLGRAAATIMAQVSVVLVALPAGMLLLTPASTAQHLGEWLAASGAPFGLALRPTVSVNQLCEEGSLSP